MKTLVRSIVVGGLALSLALTGCKKLKKDPAEEKEPAAAGSTSDVTSDRSMQVMNYYVEFFNATIEEVPGLSRNYWDQAGDAPLTVDAMGKWGNVVCAGAGWMKMKRDEAAQQVAVAKKASTGEFAKMPALAETMLAKGLAYADQRDAVCKYIKGGEWKTDGGAKAKTLHADMVAARDAWNAAADGLGDELDRVQDAQSNAELGKHGQDTYGYWFRVTTIRANELLRVAHRDVGKAEAAITALEETIAGFDKFSAAKGAGINDSFAGYGKQVARLGEAVGKLKAELAAAKTPAAKDAVIGKRFDDLVSIYNTMISLHNTLIGAEGRGALK